MKNSFVLYYEFKESIELLSDEQAGKLFKSLFDYETENKEPDFTDIAMKIVFSTIRNSLDRNKEKYEKTCQRNKVVARKRWEKVKETKTESTVGIPKSTTGIPKITKNADSDSVSDSVCDSERVCVSESDSESDCDCVNESVCVCDDASSSKNTHNENNKEEPTFVLGTFANITLTFDELVSLKDKFPMSWERRIDELSSYMASSGKTYNNVYAKLLEWKFYDKGGARETDKEKERRKRNDAFAIVDEASYDIPAFERKGLHPEWFAADADVG